MCFASASLIENGLLSRMQFNEEKGNVEGSTGIRLIIVLKNTHHDGVNRYLTFITVSALQYLDSSEPSYILIYPNCALKAWTEH